MNVVLASYQAVSILQGGPRTQIVQTARHLPSFGIQTRLFDPWEVRPSDRANAFHLFGANIGTYHLAREVHALGTPLVVSPIVFSLHSPAFIRFALSATKVLRMGGKGLWSDYGMTADICSWAAAVLPNTRAEARLLIEGYGVEERRVTVIPNGVAVEFASGDPTLFKKTYGVDRYILTVGHTGHRRKNVLSLIKALATIDHPAVIIGRIIRGEYGEECIREASRHKHIMLIDGIAPDSPMLASAYAACDTFVLPSLFETPGIAALEAALAGAKIVITKYGGTEEYFGTHARYVDPHSIESIRAGIIEALNGGKTGDLAAHIRKEFLWERVAQRTAEVYRSVAGET